MFQCVMQRYAVFGNNANNYFIIYNVNLYVFFIGMSHRVISTCKMSACRKLCQRRPHSSIPMESMAF